MTPPVPSPAATVVLLRPCPGPGFEVFLIQRVATQRFMGGSHVFPGGRVDPGDRAVVEAGLLTCGDPRALAEHMRLPVEEALTFVVTAARELLEEAGVLLCNTAKPAHAGTVREALVAGESLASALLRLGLTVNGDALKYLAHWVTPVVEPRRFGARFFVAALPAGQVPAIDHQEAVAGQWFTPLAALEAHLKGKLSLPPPTVCVVEGLSRAKDLGEALMGTPGPVHAVEPVLTQEGDLAVLALPGDVLHPDATHTPGAPTRVEIHRGVFVPARRPRP